ncbi:MAG: prolipoprotein diacylglyceryl transferase, partial [Ruminococcus sp.]|nr:prolipoprotein diacylglyceryl transferase [Ruminococcus sp.]
VLVLLFCKRIINGKLIFLYLIIYSVSRFFIEFFRGDIYRGILFGLSTSQWISILLIITSVIILIKKYIKSKKVIL